MTNIYILINKETYEPVCSLYFLTDHDAMAYVRKNYTRSAGRFITYAAFRPYGGSHA